MSDSADILDDEQFQRFLDVAPDAVVLVEPSGTIIRVNRQTEDLFGYTPEELLGRPVELLLPERYRDRHRRHRVAFHGAPHLRAMGQGLELHGMRKDGTEFPVDISLGPVQTARGVLVVAAVRDTTERRRLEEAAWHLSQAEERRRRALELNDGVVQGLTAAGMALDAGDVGRAGELLSATLASARGIVSSLLQLDRSTRLQAGALVRSDAALVRRDLTDPPDDELPA